MKSTLHRILIALIIILVLPIGLVTFYEFSKLNENETLIHNAYSSQLESIVSSLNSYTQDLVNNWALRIETSLKNNRENLSKLIDENQSISAIFITDLLGRAQVIHQSKVALYTTDSINGLMKTQSKSIKQLNDYYQANYRKTLTYSINEDNSLIYFIFENVKGELNVCFLEVNNYLFLQNHISPKMQSIAQENFIISLVNKSNNKNILATQKELDEKLKYDLEGELWLMPQIVIKIKLKSETINDLVAGRVKEGVIIFGIVLLILLLGSWFLYSSIKREIQLTQIKSEFISNVSHEIRTPLALISMYIETLEMGRVKSAEKIQEYYQIIQKETVRLTEMVNKILNFSKLENGKRPLKKSVCNLNLITQHVLETYDFHFESKGFEYVFTPAKDLPDNYCDQDSIAEVLINLIDNAVKYSHNQKRIEIRTGSEKRFTYLEVKDYGEGISKKNQKLVFDKFYRVTNENLANKVKGTGLGLAIVSEIVKSHKGKITLTSKLNEGSTFRLYFPISSNHFKTNTND